MKKITSLWLLLAAYALVACSSNPSALNTEAKPQSENKKKISQTQTKLIECAEKTNGDSSILIVSKEIMFSKLTSENRAQLFASKAKLNEQQKLALSQAIEIHQHCRVIANEFPSAQLTAVYQDTYRQLDLIYQQLLLNEITIGQANQLKLEQITKAQKDWNIAEQALNPSPK